MSITDIIRVTPDWLALREPADAAARAPELLTPLRAHLGPAPLVIRDLGCGTGSMGRWLAGLLPGPQHWVMQDRDPDLLDIIGARGIGPAADGSAVTAAALAADITGLRAADLVGTSLVTASALLDLFTQDEVDGLADACVAAGCPALCTISVLGKVNIAPADPLDTELAAAFDAHQRRVTGGRGLLGPDAPAVAAAAFRSRGATVYTSPSPWLLGADQAPLAAEWLSGWVDAAVEQRPDLADAAAEYLSRRLTACVAGELRIIVHHTDLLAIPGAAP
ncbi:MAG TPA: SAM-dependent methyltransferase [Pseudonocardiaceae bacterium]|nr:SAM-dependent methyltransferase [Pseudonocardiaceae bacterium]